MNAPGSWHDSRVAAPVYGKLRDKTLDGYYLVADTAFPRGPTLIEDKIHAPIKSGQVLPSNEADRAHLLAYNRELLSYRQTAEWGMRAIQGSFGRLRLPLEANDRGKRHCLIEVCLRLHQVRTRCVGINQIMSVYAPIWQEEEGVELWRGFEQLVHGEKERRDRVSAFHIIAVEQE